MLTRRMLIAAAGLAALLPAAQAADNPIFSEILSGVKDKATREYMERHRDDGRWDGKYFHDRQTNGAAKWSAAPKKTAARRTAARSARRSRNPSAIRSATTVGMIAATDEMTEGTIGAMIEGTTEGTIAEMTGASTAAMTEETDRR